MSDLTNETLLERTTNLIEAERAYFDAIDTRQTTNEAFYQALQRDMRPRVFTAALVSQLQADEKHEAHCRRHLHSLPGYSRS